MSQIRVSRIVDRQAPRDSIGYDIGNTVSDLFRQVAWNGGDVTLIKLDTIRISKTGNIVEVTAEYDGPDLIVRTI